MISYTYSHVLRRYLYSGGILLPTGSTEQHGPMGLIGTDTLCATAIAEAAAPLCGALVAPALAGMAVGLWIGDRLDQERFRTATLAVLVVAGMNLVRRALFA